MRTLASVVIWAWWTCCLVFFLFAVAAVRLVTFPFDPHAHIPNRMLGALARIMFRAVPGWAVHVEGADLRKLDRPTVVIANHQSFLDLPLAYHLPWRMKWVAKRSLFRVPVLGWIIWLTGHLAIDRGSSRAGLRLQHLLGPVNRGEPAMIFPEGTRTGDGELLPFKNGAFNLARKYNLQLLPIVLEGGYQAMPRGSWRLNTRQQFRISVLDPVQPDHYPDLDSLREACRGKIAKELHRLRNLDT